MNMCVIPARGGSKRIPRKNIRIFCGKPIIAWAIEAAIDSGCFELIIVSTDDDSIAEVSKAYGAEVPFKRPAYLCEDFVSTAAVVNHAVNWASLNGFKYDAVCCLQATAPFVRPDDIQNSLKLFLSGNWNFCITATSYVSPILRSFRKLEDGTLDMFFPDYFHKRSQELATALHDAAYLYWGRDNTWVPDSKLFGPNCTAYEVPHWRVQDIDTEDDWKRAEILHSILIADISKADDRKL